MDRHHSCSTSQSTNNGNDNDMLEHSLLIGLFLLGYHLDCAVAFGVSPINNDVLKQIPGQRPLCLVAVETYDTDFALINAATETIEGGNDEQCVVFCGVQQPPALYHTGAGSILLFLPNEESRGAFLLDMANEWKEGPLMIVVSPESSQHPSGGKNSEQSEQIIELIADPSAFLERFRQSEMAIQNESDITKADAALAKNPSYTDQIRLLKQNVRLRDDRIQILCEKRKRVQKPKKRRALSANEWMKQSTWQQVPILGDEEHQKAPHERVREVLLTDTLPLQTSGSALESRVWKVRRRSTTATNNAETTRLLVISDTHSMEDQFQDLPEADILIHCGENAQNPFSPFTLPTFLNEHASHIPFHLIIRGNHDPLILGTSAFGSSPEGPEQHYITKATTMAIPGGLVADLRPFTKSRKQQPPMLDNCDLIISHEPPFGILDETLQKERVGSIPLRLASSSHPPPLWLCGHIHEGRGATQLRYSDSSCTTLVVNASNANPGKADKLVAGPVLVDMIAIIAKEP
jgi:hypothetical protein